MMLSAILLVAEVLSAASLRPTGFYVAGVRQGMSLAEYNALIANGGYKSQPVDPDVFYAAINGRDVFVTFCQGHVATVIADYSASDWMQSIKELEAAGFKYGAPLVAVKDDTLRSASMSFSVTTPKGYAYYVAPMVKAAAASGRDLTAFQLRFDVIDNACR